jgi:pimeloyl-ACP methyl ester carboxylesterase
VIRHLSGPAVIVDHSISGGAATIAAAKAPELVSGIVELNPFTRTQSLKVGALFRIRRYRRGIILLLGTQTLRSLWLRTRYLNLAYPTKPADWDSYLAAMRAKLTGPGQMAEFIKTGKSTPADAGQQLANVHCPALIIMGTADPDYADPKAEGDAIAAAMPAGLATVATIDGAGIQAVTTGASDPGQRGLADHRRRPGRGPAEGPRWTCRLPSATLSSHAGTALTRPRRNGTPAAPRRPTTCITG